MNLTAALSVALLSLVAGCSLAEPPRATSPSPQSDSFQPSVNKANSDTKVNTPISAHNTIAPTKKQGVYSVVVPGNPEPTTNAEIQQYINRLATKGFPKENQGVWMQSGRTLLGNHRGTIPLPAASITKVATTLVALQTWGPKHQFVTLIGGTGAIEDGVLQGNLVIQGGEDPFFVWEDAIALGNTLNQMGIKRVTGNLALVGKFYMNYNSNPLTAGNLLKLGLNNQFWPAEVKSQYQMPPGTPLPQVVIEGSVQVMPSTPGNMRPLVRHFSLPLATILKKMNLYSNNVMAEMLADSVGGAKVVEQKAVATTGLPGEIQLKNGSGSRENRISPRAACAMFLAIENYLQPHHMTIADVFAVSRHDLGILKDRPLPPMSVVKSGLLTNVSALAGAMPTQERGSVWFAIMNVGEDLDELHAQQDLLLQSLLNQWGSVKSPPAELTLSPGENSPASRNKILSF